MAISNCSPALGRQEGGARVQDHPLLHREFIGGEPGLPATLSQKTTVKKTTNEKAKGK